MKFAHTILYVADVEKTIRFYEAAFSLKQKFIHEGGYVELKRPAKKPWGQTVAYVKDLNRFVVEICSAI